MIRDFDTWFSFARRLGLVLRREDIILVTGCDLTRSWTNIAFLGRDDVVLHHGPEGMVRLYAV